MATLALLGIFVGPLAAQESVCARVKIEIKQELTLERQAFDAEMRITNSLPAIPLTHVSVDVKVTDENGVPVTITTDPNDLTAKFFIRQTKDDTSGSGQVPASSTAVLNWMLIPAPGSAGETPFGKRYLVGATLRYQFGTETHTMELNPDSILVKPMPSLTLDYFLTRDIIADDPFTTEIEAPEPYTLGVRVKNSGLAAANKLKIDSAQPRIVENLQGLPINFVILGSYVQDMPATNSLLIDFGNIAPNSSKMGRWQMESNLAGTFVDFSATFTHSDELGGSLTSLLQGTNAHLLVRDVRVDLPGRDIVRDFLAVDGGLYKVYESDGVDSAVTDRSAEAQLAVAGSAYQLVMPATQGFFYVRKADPHRGQMALSTVVRADAKQMAPENVWLSKTKNRDTQQWDYWFNVFDVNSPGGYQVAFKPLDQDPRPPVLQFIPDRVVKENEQVSFLVEASSPMGKSVTLSASPLPAGATFQDQRDGTAVFDWTPEEGQAGSYVINYVASDGSLSGTRSAKIRVESIAPPAGPAIPQVVAPLSGAQVASQKPALQVLTGEASNDPTQSVHFQIYGDVGMSELVGEATVPKNPTAGQPTQWQPESDLDDNRRYHWRARAIGAGGVNSEWVSSTFFVNLFNDPPGSFNLTSPQAGADVATLTPQLSATNAVDPDGDEVTYGFEVYTDTALTQLHDSVSGLTGGESGSTQWTVAIPLSNHATYYWRAIATDTHGARTLTPARSFRVFTGNQAPTAPTIASPLPGSRVTTEGTATLQVNNAVDADGDAVTYDFEIDVVNTFDSSARQASPSLPEGAGGVTSWQAVGLVENQHYYWRVKASDGHSQSEWVQGDFILDAQNEAPSVPTLANPGDRAWVNTLHPTFTVHPSQDPEEDALLYAFEVYTDAGMSSRVATGTSSTPSWQSTTALTDKTTHYWRARARDVRGAASEWTPLSTLFISTDSYVPPTIAVTSPATLTDASSRMATIAWNGTDPNIEPKIALYYDQTGSGFAGIRIVDGLTQDAGTHSGSYTWNMSGLSSGVYYVYGVIYDDKGLSRAYAPGSLVIPASPQLGGIRVTAPSDIRINETLGLAMFTVTLTRAPTHEVKVPLSSSDTSEATVQPQQLTFTPQNWWLPQIAQISAVKDNVRDGDQPFEITVGRASSQDPQYMGALGQSVRGTTVDNGVHTSTDNLSVSGYQRVSKTYIPLLGRWTYRYRISISNDGPKVNTVTATVSAAPGFNVVSGTLLFGAIGQNESANSLNEIILTSTTDIGEQDPDLTWSLKAL
ncbi:hypothetical protein CSC75_03055 [Pseudoxanthomonas wuyuanensis]|nr:hypothetical protein CSC75_03055 [Pseudoxanthomonas wuyuanensis]